MTARHPRLSARAARMPVPRCWLMTDERMSEALWAAVDRLPRGAGIIMRHYASPLAERRALFARLAVIARRRGLVLVRAGGDRLGRQEAGVHGRDPRRSPGLKTWPAHDLRELRAGVRAGADVILVSPVFMTRSHPGARSLGRVRAAMLARQAPVPVIALGGVSSRERHWLRLAGFYGWAGIDAWLVPPDQL